MKSFRIIFTLGVLLAGLFVSLKLAKGSPIDTGLLSLLPLKESDPVLAEANDLISRQGSRLMAFALTHPDAESAAKDGQYLIDRLEASGQVATFLTNVTPEKEAAFRNLYFPLRYQLLSPNDRERISRPDALPYFLNRLRGSLFNPTSAFISGTIPLDPFLFFIEYMRDALGNTETVGESFFLAVELKGDPFNSKTQEAFFTWLEGFRKTLSQKDPQAALFATGVMSFARAQRVQTEGELYWMTLGSLVGVLGLLLWAFKKPTTVLIAVLPVVIGMMAGFAATIAVFGRVHIITLTFGTTLIGCSLDYPIHFLAHRRIEGKGVLPEDALKKLTPGLLLSMGTSVMGYLALGVAPLPGLQQIAVFSSVGLLFALGTVYAWLPRFPVEKPSNSAPHPLVGGAERGLAFINWIWNGPFFPRAILSLFLLFVIVKGLSQVHFDDDIRLLQKTPTHVVQEDAEVRKGGGLEGNRFILIEGSTEEILLRRQERLYDRLSLLLREGALSSVQSLAPLLPSLERQENNAVGVRRLILSHSGEVQKELQKVGLTPAVGNQLLKDMAMKPDPLTPKRWLGSPASEGFRTLWIGKKEKGFSSATLVGGVREKDAFEKRLAGLEGIRYFDQLKEFSNVLGRYRKQSMILVAIASVLACVLLIFRYGFGGGLRANIPPLVAILLTFSLLGWAHIPLNIFHSLAAVIVLAMGVDYTIFFSECRRSPALLHSALLSVSLSAVTTLVSFGLLSFCSTPAVAALGQTTFLGLLFSFLLSPTPFVFKRDGSPR